MDALKYLERIGLKYDRVPPLSYALLRELQLAHVCAVPYENMDIINKKPLSLDPEALFEKIVLRRRGGYCFELNCLFEALLKALGFCTTAYFARFWRGETGTPLRRHRVIAVRIGEETYIADVGIGSPAPRIPLLLKEGLVQEYFGESYRFERDEIFGWVLYELHHGEWKKYFSFTEEAQLENDFYAISYYCEHHSDSKFNKNYMIAMKTETGRISVDGFTFKRFEGAELSFIEENMSALRMKEVLASEFGLEGIEVRL